MSDQIKQRDSNGNWVSAIDKQKAASLGSSDFALLRRFINTRSIVERCELCGVEVASTHSHLVEPSTRKLLCACQACAILFSSKAGTKYRRVPTRVLYLPDFKLTNAQWDSLMIPINMAFFFDSSTSGAVVSLYPSPAGATESQLELGAWQEIVKANPVLTQMEADTEALLVNRVREEPEYFLLPIDQCYKLVGLIRTKWRGLGGGKEVWEEIANYFADLKQRAQVVSEHVNA